MINVSNLRQTFRNQELNELKEVKNAIQNGDPTVENNILIRNASARGNTEAVRLLLQDGRADPTVWRNYAIIEASRNGHTEVVRLLLEDGRADPRADNNVAIRDATFYGNTEVVRILLQDSRVDLRVNDHIVLREALRRGHEDIVMLLLDWYGEHDVPINQIFNIIPDRYRKYILVYYDLNEIPLDTYDFKIRENEEDQRLVEYVLTKLAYDTQRRERFLRLINPAGYNLRGAGVGVRGVRNIISEYAGFYPERSSVITETLDDIGLPRELTAIIGSSLVGRRSGAGAGAGLDAEERKSPRRKSPRRKSPRRKSPRRKSPRR